MRSRWCGAAAAAAQCGGGALCGARPTTPWVSDRPTAVSPAPAWPPNGPPLTWGPFYSQGDRCAAIVTFTASPNNKLRRRVKTTTGARH